MTLSSRVQVPTHRGSSHWWSRGCTVLALTASTFVCTSVASTHSAFAQSDADKATARSLGQEGQTALDAKDFKTAEDRFRRAESLYHAPTLALGLARSLAANGKVVAAQETYNRIIREGVAPGAPAVFAKAVEDAKTEVNSVSPRVAGVTISVVGPPPDAAKVTLDDTPVPSAALGVKRPVDPGAHVVKATADGYENGEQKFSVAEGGAATVSLTMKKGAAPPVAVVPVPAPGQTATTTPAGAPVDSMSSADTGTASKGSSQTTFGWAALAVGGVGLVAGGVTGLIAIGKHGTLKDSCTNGVCPSSSSSDLDSYHTMGTISTVAFIVGGVGVAAGVVLLLTAPKSQTASLVTPVTKPEITPYIGFGTVGAVGRF